MRVPANYATGVQDMRRLDEYKYPTRSAEVNPARVGHRSPTTGKPYQIPSSWDRLLLVHESGILTRK